MGVAVQFIYANWAALFPQFSSVSQDQVTNLVLPLAEQYCRNDGYGPVETSASQTNLLNLMVAHVCQLLFGVNGQQPSPLIGRLSNATEGSVSVSVEFPTTPANAWYLQTPFGAMYWQATAPYRTMRYRPARRRCFSSGYLGGG